MRFSFRDRPQYLGQEIADSAFVLTIDLEETTFCTKFVSNIC